MVVWDVENLARKNTVAISEVIVFHAASCSRADCACLEKFKASLSVP